MQRTSCEMMKHKLDEAQAGIKTAGRISKYLRYTDDTTVMSESKEEVKSLLMKVKEEGEKSWLKIQHSKNEDHGIWSHHFIANRWGNHGNSDKTFLGLQNHADGDCSHEIKRYLLLGRKAMINLDSILKSRHITLPTKFRLVKAMVFPVVMYGCESWTIKDECQRIDAFELWYWRRLLRDPWTARSFKPVNPREISPE